MEKENKQLREQLEEKNKIVDEHAQHIIELEEFLRYLNRQPFDASS